MACAQSLMSANHDKHELNLEIEFLRSQHSMSRQEEWTDSVGETEHKNPHIDNAHARDNHIINNLREECGRVTAECFRLKETNGQLTRKLSASLKNKVELEKVHLHMNIFVHLTVEHTRSHTPFQHAAYTPVTYKHGHF